MKLRGTTGSGRRVARSRGRGQALVEFAITAPIFLFMLFAIIDFGRYVYYVQILNNAAREGARYAIVNGAGSFTPTGPDPDNATVEAVVRKYAVGVIGSDAVLVVHSCWKESGCPGNPFESPSNQRGQKVRVSVTYAFRPIIPMVPIPDISITGESTLVINH
jgi:Flp pilus assembly protein TadG